MGKAIREREIRMLGPPSSLPPPSSFLLLLFLLFFLSQLTAKHINFLPLSSFLFLFLCYQIFFLLFSSLIPSFVSYYLPVCLFFYFFFHFAFYLHSLIFDCIIFHDINFFLHLLFQFLSFLPSFSFSLSPFLSFFLSLLYSFLLLLLFVLLTFMPSIPSPTSLLSSQYLLVLSFLSSSLPPSSPLSSFIPICIHFSSHSLPSSLPFSSLLLFFFRPTLTFSYFPPTSLLHSHFLFLATFRFTHPPHTLILTLSPSLSPSFLWFPSLTAPAGFPSLPEEILLRGKFVAKCKVSLYWRRRKCEGNENEIMI